MHRSLADGTDHSICLSKPPAAGSRMAFTWGCFLINSGKIKCRLFFSFPCRLSFVFRLLNVDFTRCFVLLQPTSTVRFVLRNPSLSLSLSLSLARSLALPPTPHPPLFLLGRKLCGASGVTGPVKGRRQAIYVVIPFFVVMTTPAGTYR